MIIMIIDIKQLSICTKWITAKTKSFYQNRLRKIYEIDINVFYGAQQSKSFSNIRGTVKKIVRHWFNILTTVTEQAERISKTMFEFALP